MHCISCGNFVAKIKECNPANLSAEAIKKAAITTFVLSLLALTAVVLMGRYPQVSGGFATCFAITSIAGFIIFIVMCAKGNRQQAQAPEIQEQPVTNPFQAEDPNV